MAKIKRCWDNEIILSDLDFFWKKEDMRKFKSCWNNGISLVDISRYLKRDIEEVFLLALHLAREGEIEKREGYIWGK